jgi:endonuclease/exonuclease/phosphatase family metal-dependent hydrolase
VIVRSWNLFHGNTVPTGRDAYLDEMVRLATEDEPDVACFQEVPAWALGRFTAGDVAAHPTVGPLRISAGIGKRITDLNHGVLRSAFAGQGNAMTIAPRLRVLDHQRLVLNTRRFRDAESRKLGLGVVARLAWAKERRIVQAVRVAAADGRTFLVANTHCTSFPRDTRLAQAELIRAAWFATGAAGPGDVVILAGDFNVTAASPALRELTSDEWGFSAAGPGIDHVLVRGATVSETRRWPSERRRYGGRLLSDHAPVEVEIT